MNAEEENNRRMRIQGRNKLFKIRWRTMCSEGMAEIKFKNARHIISVCTFVPT
jgi:hypothetical protein